MDSYALLSTKCISSLHAPNKLRNRCVHTFNTRPTVNDVLKVVAQLGEEFQAERATGDAKGILTAYLGFLCGHFAAAYFDLVNKPKTKG